MKAAVVVRYGGPENVKVREVPDPLCGPRDVVIRSIASTLDSGDARVRAMRMPPGFGLPARLAFGVMMPRRPVLGTAVCGRVHRVGASVTRARVGDLVVGITGMRFGTHAELVALGPANPIAAVPVGIPARDAVALVFGGMTALHYVRDLAKVRPGERVLVHGASGAVGIAAVQIARHLGAEVEAVTSGVNAELVRGLGASRVIDYTQHDPTAERSRYDVVVETVGGRGFSEWKGALRPGGRCAFVVAGWREFLDVVRTVWSSRRALAGVAPEREASLLELMTLAEAGSLRSVVDSEYPLAEVAGAHARVDSGRKRGSVVIRFEA